MFLQFSSLGAFQFPVYTDLTTCARAHSLEETLLVAQLKISTPLK
jgi:hypothetical protein